MVENTSTAFDAEGRLPEAPLARVGMALADWSERWFPDSFVFSLIMLVIVFMAGLALGTPVRNLVQFFGQGFWSLIPFTMQMAMIIIGGYVVATSPPVYALICRLARIPRTPRRAVAFVAFFSMMTSLISWGFALIFCWPAGARSRAARARDRLSRDRRGGLSGQRHRVGAGAFVVGSALDGDSVFDSGGVAQNQRRDSAEPDDLHVAEPRNGRDPYARINQRRVLFRPEKFGQDG